MNFFPTPVQLPPTRMDDVYNTKNITDFGATPLVLNIEKATKQNNTFRTVLWTGENLQLTLMNIKPGEEIGLELHSDVDQFIRLESGQGLVQMGDTRERLDFFRVVEAGDSIIIPAGKWHNLKNIGNESITLYSIYAPPEHPFGTVHATKAIADAAEHYKK
ncbi:cupin domain-containing protein [Sporosarcina sp. PTS2304]|nr:cupin domain-containing protein [Sporosarcina sp. PTS2304]